MLNVFMLSVTFSYHFLIVMLTVVMLSVIKLSVVMLSVVAPTKVSSPIVPKIESDILHKDHSSVLMAPQHSA